MKPAAARVLVVLTGVLLVAAVLAAYAERALFDSERFADRAAAALQDPSMRQAISERVTDELVLGGAPDLLAARPIIVSAVSGVVGSDAFAGLFRRGVRDVHGAVFRSDQDTLTLTLADVGIVVAAAIRQLDPALAAQIEGEERITLLTRDLGSVSGDLARLARQVHVLAVVLAVLTLAAGAAAVAVSADRRRTVSQLGAAIVVAGVAIVVADVVARSIVLDRVSEPDDRAAAGAVWDAFLGDLRTAGWVIAACGAVVAAAAASVLRPVEVEEPLLAAWRVVTTEPQRTLWRVVRGVLLVAAGLLVLSEPIAAVRIAVTLTGVYVLYKGVEALLRLTYRPGAEPAPRTRRRLPRLVVAGAAAVLIAAGLAGFVASGGVDETVASITRCNGHAELCDRPLDEVTLPATHNSMSAPLPGWFSALQDRSIGGQLEDGVRGLLLDTHYADLLPNGRTRTYFEGPEELQRTIEQDGVSEQTVEAAERLRERLGFRGEGERGMYLCHTFCEIGSTPLADALDEIHEFLVTHPAEVLVVVNQDAVTPSDFVGAIDDAGLTPYVLEPPSGDEPWPTLREMIEQDRRLVVMAENEAGSAPWYQLAYERLTQETPFSFNNTALLTDPENLPASCEPNRGRAGAPLFLVNHWINTDPAPLPSNAATVNARGPLLRRAHECERIRGKRINLLAVDFYRRGDLFEIVDELNGV